MENKKTMTILVAVVLLFAVTFAVEAGTFGPHMQKRGMGSGFGGLRVFLDLKLSDPQQETMTNIINKYQDLREGLRERLIETRQNLTGVLNAEPFNEETARKAFRKASTVREDMFVLRAKMMAEMKAVLTPEQLELFKERKPARFERMKGRFGARSEKSSQ